MSDVKYEYYRLLKLRSRQGRLLWPTQVCPLPGLLARVSTDGSEMLRLIVLTQHGAEWCPPRSRQQSLAKCLVPATREPLPAGIPLHGVIRSAIIRAASFCDLVLDRPFTCFGKDGMPIDGSELYYGNTVARRHYCAHDELLARNSQLEYIVIRTIYGPVPLLARYVELCEETTELGEYALASIGIVQDDSARHSARTVAALGSIFTTNDNEGNSTEEQANTDE